MNSQRPRARIELDASELQRWPARGAHGEALAPSTSVLGNRAREPQLYVSTQTVPCERWAWVRLYCSLASNAREDARGLEESHLLEAAPAAEFRLFGRDTRSVGPLARWPGAGRRNG
jgi:hypothetical protein